MSKEVGFTGKVTSHSSGLYLNIPNLTVQSLGLEGGDLLHMKIKSMIGAEKQVSRKAQEVSGNFKVYLPAQVKEDLGLKHKELVDVFLSKD